MADKAPETRSASSSPPMASSAPTASARSNRTRKAGEVRSRSGCLTCKQRRKKCDEDFRLRANGLMACNRCADRRIDCEMSNPVPASVSASRHSPYPSSSSPNKPLHRSGRSVSTTHPSLTQNAVDPGAHISAALDPTQPWNPAQYNMQQQSQQPAFQPPFYPNQMPWPNQGPSAQNLSAMRYNRPNIWPPSNNAIPIGYESASISVPNTNNSAHAPADMAALYHFMNGNSASAAPTNSSQWNPTYTNSVDNMMLDDFVNELMSLTGPLVGNEGVPTASSVDTTPVAQSIVTSPSDARPKSNKAKSARPSAQPPSVSGLAASNGTSNPSSQGRQRQLRSSQQYQNLLASDAIESLLSKYSPIYEQFWHATLLVLSEKRRQAAVDYLMGVIRSNKACRASVVVVCLAYHELVQRVRKQSQSRPSDAREKSQPANWTTLASESFKKHQTPLGDQGALSHPILTMFPDSMDEQTKQAEIDGSTNHSSGDQRCDETSSTDAGSKSKQSENGSKSTTPSRNLTGKLSTVENDIHEMDDPNKDALKGEKVQDLAVELWFDIAQAELERSRDDLTLEQEICAIINLRWACLCFAGAERTRQLTEELGRVIHRSGIDLAHMVEEEKKGSLVSIMLQTAVYTDILDAACERGKRASVPLRNEAGRVSQPELVSRRRKGAIGADDAPFFGKVSLLSLELLTCFKMISDLAADVWGEDGAAARPSDDQIAARSRDLERKIMSLPAWSDPHTSSSLRVRAFALQEIWRQTARLYMLQSVHKRGPLHPELQAILHEIIRLAKMIKIQSLPPQLPAATVTHYAQPLSSTDAERANHHAPSDYVGGLRSVADPYATTSYAPDSHAESGRTNSHPDVHFDEGDSTDSDHNATPTQHTAAPASAGPPPFHPFQMWLDVASWEMCTVWFLCSTVAMTSSDRQFCIHHLDSLGLERANRDNVQVIRDFWAKQDETGHSLDWFDFVKSSNRCVVFAF